MCGENNSRDARTRNRKGSSPRVRGKRGATPLVIQSGRLIPACAGKTDECAAAVSDREAHPRVCGENLPATRCGLTCSGSSPRVRGKLTINALSAADGGLIPACAGKTRSGLTGLAPSRAHPRVCGENRIASSRIVSSRGSSPRVRGKPHEQRRERPYCGLIPACAGKTFLSLRGEANTGAHPRVCGENLVISHRTAYG